MTWIEKGSPRRTLEPVGYLYIMRDDYETYLTEHTQLEQQAKAAQQAVVQHQEKYKALLKPVKFTSDTSKTK